MHPVVGQDLPVRRHDHIVVPVHSVLLIGIRVQNMHMPEDPAHRRDCGFDKLRALSEHPSDDIGHIDSALIQVVAVCHDGLQRGELLHRGFAREGVVEDHVVFLVRTCEILSRVRRDALQSFVSVLPEQVVQKEPFSGDLLCHGVDLHHIHAAFMAADIVFGVLIRRAADHQGASYVQKAERLFVFLRIVKDDVVFLLFAQKSPRREGAVVAVQPDGLSPGSRFFDLYETVFCFDVLRRSPFLFFHRMPPSGKAGSSQDVCILP